MIPATVYACIGFLVGTFTGFLFADSRNPLDLLVGAFFGVFIGILLAMSKYKIWSRK